MSRAVFERNAVIVLFFLVLVIFSMAEKDRKKAMEHYRQEQAVRPVPKASPILISTQLPSALAK